MASRHKIITPNLEKGKKYFCEMCADTQKMKILKENGEIIYSKCVCVTSLPITINK